MLRIRACALAAPTGIRRALLLYLKGKWGGLLPTDDGPICAAAERLISLMYQHWASEIADIADAVLHDQACIAAMLKVSSSGFPKSMDCGLSDPHLGGRTVHILRYADGLLVLKPRSVTQEDLVRRILMRVGNRLDIQLPSVAAMSINGRGYCEYVPHCDYLEPELSFFFNAGATLLVCELLGMTDCHPRNVHMSPVGPVIVDCETVFHPTFDTSMVMWDQPADGPLRSELLHTLAPMVADERHLDALKRGYATLWTALGTDGAFRASILEDIHSFAGQSTRVVYRATRFYLRIIHRLRECAAAGREIDEMQLAKILSRRFRATDYCHPACMLIAAEAAALARLDVPRFEMVCDERSIRERGVVLAREAVAQSGLDDSLARLSALPQRSLAQTLEIVGLYVEFARLRNRANSLG